MGESMVTMPMSVLLRFGRYDDMLKLPQPPASRAVMTAFWHFGRGVALARMGRADEAGTERSRMVEVIATVPESALFGGTGLESARGVLGVGRTVLDARIAAARGQHAQAISLWQQAVAAADRFAYDEPPVWYYPMRESLGAALLKAGRAADAEQVFRDDLTRHPRNARSLFGLQESLKAQGRQADAAWVQRAFEDAWQNADSKLALDEL
jgi:tetratricopeptide (TPR) repeat protein